MAKIIVKGTEVTIISVDDKDYISLTDMVRGIVNGLALIEKWLRNKNTIEFLGIWEEMYNPGFNSPEFEGIKNEDFICITDMIKVKGGSFFVTDWLRNRNALKHAGIWEQVYNPNFNYGEFATIRNNLGLNTFKICVKEYIKERLMKLNKIAIRQMKILQDVQHRKLLK